jgi:hypothetical protein
MQQRECKAHHLALPLRQAAPTPPPAAAVPVPAVVAAVPQPVTSEGGNGRGFDNTRHRTQRGHQDGMRTRFTEGVKG